MSPIEATNRRTLAKVLASAFLAAVLLAGDAGTAQAKGLDDLVDETPEIKHGIEVENEVEHAVGIENELENKLENELEDENEDELEDEVEDEVEDENEVENEVAG